MGSSPPPPPHQPTPGSSFYPQNHQLLTEYLHPKLAGLPLPAPAERFLREADVYAEEPGTLTSFYDPGPARIPSESKIWYFFCPVKPDIARDGRKPRIVGGGKGTWKDERGEAVLDPVEGLPVGRLDRFTYIPKPKQKDKPTEWLMVEFTLDEQVGDGEPRFSLCKIYRSPRFMKASLSAESACKSKASARKRKAAVSPASSSASARKSLKIAGESSTVRRQLLFPEPVTDEAFLGKNCDSVSQELRSPSPPPPIPLGEGDQFWSEFFNRIGELPELPDIPAAPIGNAPYPLAEEPCLGDDQSWSGVCELSDPSPTPPTDETFLGDNSSSTSLLQSRSPPAANSTAEVYEQMVRYLADDNNWEEQRNYIGELPAAPWPCSMTVPPVPFCSGINFCSSIAAP
ncbi:unnamed protein product [Alopecurus aequalis]